MTLTFPNPSRSYDARRHAVRFWGYQSALECSFFVSFDALRQLQPETKEDEAGLLRAFDAHRDQIYKAAAKVFARGRKGSYDLMTTDV